MGLKREDFGTVGPKGRDDLFDKRRKDQNIVGLALGERQRNGKTTGEPALVVCVAEKRGPSELEAGEELPSVYRHGNLSIPVDVQETGPMYATIYGGFERPAPSGISIGHFRVTAGTLGTLVDDLGDGKTCILSNNHVLANENSAVAGDPILQPGSYDGGIDPLHRIATLRRFVPINFSGANNRVDAAIALPLNPALVQDQMKNGRMPVISANHQAVGLLFAGSKYGTLLNPISDVLNSLGICFLGGARSFVPAVIGKRVEKVGRTSEYTTSEIAFLDARMTVNYSGGKQATFDGQIFCRPSFASGGDSGSIVAEGNAGTAAPSEGCCAASTETGVLLGGPVDDRDIARVRGYLRQSRAGRLLTLTFFINELPILARVGAVAGRMNEPVKAMIQALYQQRLGVLRAALDEPTSESHRLKEQHVLDMRSTLLAFKPYLTEDEHDFFRQTVDVFAMAVGSTSAEFSRFLDSDRAYDAVKAAVHSLKSFRKPKTDKGKLTR